MYSNGCIYKQSQTKSLEIMREKGNIIQNEKKNRMETIQNNTYKGPIPKYLGFLTQAFLQFKANRLVLI